MIFTPEMLRADGFAGSACSNALFEPVAPYSFRVHSASAVAARGPELAAALIETADEINRWSAQ